MSIERPSIKLEIDKLDRAEEERQQQEAAAAFIKSFLDAFDQLPKKQKDTLLDLMDPTRARLRKEDI